MINTSMTERRPRQTLTRISVSSIARKIYAIAVSPNPTWEEYEWLVNTSKNEIVVNDFKRSLEIDVLDTSSTFDRMNGDKMAELMQDQKIISKALALLIELQDETRIHRIWAQKKRHTIRMSLAHSLINKVARIFAKHPPNLPLRRSQRAFKRGKSLQYTND